MNNFILYFLCVISIRQVIKSQIFKASKMFPIKFYAKIIKSAQVTRVNLITIRIFSQNDIVKIL